MRIATMATGGIGGFLAVKLANAGHEVATIARGAHLDAIRANGLRLEHADRSEVAHPWIATDDPSEVGGTGDRGPVLAGPGAGQGGAQGGGGGRGGNGYPPVTHRPPAPDAV